MSTDASSIGSALALGRLGRLVRTRSFAIGVSLTLHAALFAVFYAVGIAGAADPKRVIIPEARLAGGESAEAPRPETPARLTQPPDPPVQPKAPRLDELQILTTETPAPGAESVEASPTQLALPGLDLSSGGSPGAAVTLGAVGPAVRFFGQTGNAYKVVYVVDVSASLLGMEAYIYQQMHESIQSLVPSQQFQIVLAKDGILRELASGKLVPANSAYKTAAYDFIGLIKEDMKPGSADQVEAMRRAFALRPELICFLTDAFFQNRQEDLEASLKRLNAHGETEITVIGFNPFPATKAFLERIARDHGGNCRFVDLK